MYGVPYARLIRSCVHGYMSVCLVCVNGRVYIYIHIHAYIYIYIYTYIYTYIYLPMCISARACSVYMHVYFVII